MKNFDNYWGNMMVHRNAYVCNVLILNILDVIKRRMSGMVYNNYKSELNQVPCYHGNSELFRILYRNVKTIVFQ